MREMALRDKFAMSFKDIPKLQDEGAVKFIEEKIGAKLSDDPILFSVKYEAYVRYQYADAMMEFRDPY